LTITVSKGQGVIISDILTITVSKGQEIIISDILTITVSKGQEKLIFYILTVTVSKDQGEKKENIKYKLISYFNKGNEPSESASASESFLKPRERQPSPHLQEKGNL